MNKALLFAACALALCSTSCGQKPQEGTSPAVSAKPAATASTGDVYLRTTIFRGLHISWVYLGKDGVIVMDPKHGVNPINLAAEKQDNPAYTGTYKLAGDKLLITWQNGKSAEWGIEFDDKKAISAIDGGLATKQPPLPADYRIEGKFSARASTANLLSSTTLTFSKDGTFTQGSFGGVSTADTGATSQSSTSGTYTISGNTLTLTFADGKKTHSVITIMDLGKRYLVIDSAYYPQEK